MALFADTRGLLAQTAEHSPGAIVETTAGRVRGLLVDRVQTFKAVPYGTSTAGARRFLPPVKVAPWTGVRDVVESGANRGYYSVPRMGRGGWTCASSHS